MLLDIATTQIPNTWVYGLVTSLLGVVMALIIYVYVDFKGYIKNKMDKLDASVQGLHKDLEPIKIELGIHREKIENVEKKVDNIYTSQIHDNRDIQVLQVKVNQLAKTA